MTVEQIKVGRFELLMDAGTGAQKAGDILIDWREAISYDDLV